MSYRKSADKIEPIESRPMGWELALRFGEFTSTVLGATAIISGLFAFMLLSHAYVKWGASPEHWRGLHVFALLFVVSMLGLFKAERK